MYFINSLWVRISRSQELQIRTYIYGKRQSGQQLLSTEPNETHKMRPAYRKRSPNRCVENIIVLFPRNSRRRKDRSATTMKGSITF